MSKLIALAPPPRAPAIEKLPWASTYTVAVAERICDEVAAGKTLSQIGKEAPWAPSARTICRWFDDHPEFRAAYEEARRIKADALAQEIVTLADNARTDLEMARLPLQIQSRQWLAARMAPRDYGDRRLVETNAQVRVRSLTKIDVSHLSMDEMRIAERALLKAVGQIEADAEEED